MPRKTSPAKQTRQERRSARRAGQVSSAPRQDFGQEPQTKRIKPNNEVITPLTTAQHRYDQALKAGRIIFAIGPAGTGKTWLPVVRAADQLREGLIDKIILTRPAVEAGEKLGFLPGELEEKYAPYLLPFVDALEWRLGSGHLEHAMKTKDIEARPLGFMRGSTLKNAVVLVDEAQNLTRGQMRMLLTRIGTGATFVITGDPDQSDLPPGQSGLEAAVDQLKHIEGVSVVRFSNDDVVRDDICHKIVVALQNF